MDFDQMMESWKAQDEAPIYGVNRDLLQLALQNEQAKIRRTLRTRRRGLLIAGIFGVGMALWAGFWIAITLTNGWPAVYAVAAGASLGVFVLGVGALWLSRGRAPKPTFGNTLEEEVRRSLALVDHQLSITRRWLLVMLGTVSILVGSGLFSWTINRSQDIPTSFGGWLPFSALVVGLIVWAFYKEREEMRKAKPKLECRQSRLRALLATLDAGE